jgi:hypothetical protein
LQSMLACRANTAGGDRAEVLNAAAAPLATPPPPVAGNSNTFAPVPAPVPPPGAAGSPNAQVPVNPPVPVGNANDKTFGLGGPSLCPASGFCDGFETAPVGGAPLAPLWSVVVNDSSSTVQVDAQRAARGQKSVHVHTENKGYAQALLRTQSFFPAANNQFYGRAFVYFKNSGVLPQMHWTLFAASGVLPGQTQTTVARYGGQFTHLMANYFGQDQYAHAGDAANGGWINETKMPANRWACFEWHFKGSGNEMHLWLDEQEVTKIAIFNISTQCCPNQPWTLPPFEKMDIGWETYQADSTQSGYDLWVDEVMLDTQRIGCSR